MHITWGDLQDDGPQETQGQAIYTGRSSEAHDFRSFSRDLPWALWYMEMHLSGFPQCNSCLRGSTRTRRNTTVCTRHEVKETEQREETEEAQPPSTRRENTHVCVPEIKTICLSPDSTAARSGAVTTITIRGGILCGTFLMKDAEELTTHLEMTFSTCSATVPGRRKWQPDNKADLQHHLEG